MEKKSRARVLIAVIACVLVGAIVIASVSIAARYGGFKQFWYAVHGGEVQYPLVLVHGLGGWGERETDDPVEYWGATTGSLAQYLRSEGHMVCVPSVGPYSSTWDRTCELYAQLTGTTVDYGMAHAEQHHHARYGRTYDTALVPKWGDKENGGQRIRINLVGHSFGGATVRMLAHLLANGDDAETAATGSETSPLFTGDKADWVFSVTTLCAPHNGSQLTCIVDDLGSLAGIDNTTDLAVDLLFRAVRQYGGSGAFDDLMLDQFGVGTHTADEDGVSDAIKAVESAGTDHAFYELSPDGAAQLNRRIATVDSVYYFSFAYSTTKEGTVLRGMVPETNTLPVLYPLALAMGSYTGTTAGGIGIDESWQDNDGLVSVISAQYPFGEIHAELPASDEKHDTGVWYVAPTSRGDHGTPVGLNADTTETHQLYNALLERLETIRS